jgi:hypothetical protein
VNSIVFTVSVNKNIEALQNPSELPGALHLTLTSAALGIIALFLPKISVALLLVHILKPPRWLRISFVSLTVTTLLLGAVGIVIEFVQCNPIPGQWDPVTYNPTCWSPNIQIDYSLALGGKFYI